jgi:hypothetical protein
MARESDVTPLFTLPRWTFRLLQLFLVTAAIALGLVALRSASPTWVGAMMGLALLALAGSILLIIFRRAQQRAYWIGFATFGWLYAVLLAAGWWPVDPNSDVNSPYRAHNFLTQQLSSATYHWLYDKAFEKYFASSPYTGMGGSGGYSGPYAGGAGSMYAGSGMPVGPGMGGPAPIPGPPPGPNESDFVRVAHALWTLFFAAIGGCLAGWLYATGPGRIARSEAALP